jgi:hypothetical protein
MLVTGCTKEQYDNIGHTRWVSTAHADVKLDPYRMVVGIKHRGEYSMIGFHNKADANAAFNMLVRGIG